MLISVFFFFKQKTAYEMRISDWSSDVCSSDLVGYQLQGLMMDNEGILPEALNDAAAGGARVLYTMPTLQNHTGCIMSANRRREIASLARQHDLWIVEDDVYAVFAEGTAPPHLASFILDRTIYKNERGVLGERVVK